MKIILAIAFVMVCLMGTIAEAKYQKITKFTRQQIEQKLLAGDKNFPHNDFTAFGIVGGLDFSNANLTGGGFDGRIEKPTKFAGADLNGASFRGTSVYGVDFSNAKMTGADFLCAKVHAANWQGADLTKATVREVNFSGKTETGRKGSNTIKTWMPTNLAGVNFTDADCRDAKFNGTNCTGANFTGADLTGAGFVSAKLNGAIVNLGTTKGINFSEWKKQGAIIQD